MKLNTICFAQKNPLKHKIYTFEVFEY